MAGFGIIGGELVWVGEKGGGGEDMMKRTWERGEGEWARGGLFPGIVIREVFGGVGGVGVFFG